MPWMNRRAVEIDEAKIKRRTMPELRKRTEIWYRGREDGAAESRIYHIGLLDPGSQQMNNVTVLSLGPDFTMRRRWDAREMRWMDADDAWRLGDGRPAGVPAGPARPGGDVQGADRQAARAVPGLRPGPAGARRDELQGAPGVHRPAPGRRAQGREVHRRPPVEDRPSPSPTRSWCWWGSRSPSSPRGAAGSSGSRCAWRSGSTYFIVHSAAVALARTEILPPLVAAWSANALFATLGLFLYLRART